MAHTKARPKYATPIVHGILAMTVAAVLVASCEPDHARTQVTALGAAEEEPTYNVPCGGEQSFEIRGTASVTRSVVDHLLRPPQLPIPNATALLGYCKTKHANLCPAAKGEAKRRARAACRADGRRIASLAKCVDEDDENQGEDDGSGEGTDDPDPGCGVAPTIKRMQCNIVDSENDDCQWTAELIKNEIVSVCVSRKKRTGCVYRNFRKLSIKCSATKTTSIKGSVLLSCPGEEAGEGSGNE
jgi:hypothetical protein